MKFVGIFFIVFSIISAVLIGNSDATVSGWYEPTIGTASGTATYTVAETDITIATLNCSVGGAPAYAIYEQPTSARLDVNTTSGELAVASGKTLDYETEPTYVFKVTCTDDADDAVGTATITLNVTNVNEPPDFSQTQFSLTVPDGTTEGYTLVTVTVTDPEEDTITTALGAGNDDGHWTLDGNTIKVATGETLDQATLGGYSLEVEADDGTSTSTATVWVVVKTCSSATAVVAGGLAMVVTVALSLLL